MSWTVAVGVDTHKDEHVAVACDRVGAQLDVCAFEATEAGFAGLSGRSGSASRRSRSRVAAVTEPGSRAF